MSRLQGERLWILQADTGEFGEIDRASGRFTPLCFLPGFARGLAFAGNHAVIGVSRPRENRSFDGLVLNERLDREGAAPRCGIYVVNLTSGDVEHRLEIEGAIEELYDVGFIPGVTRPMALGFKTDEIRFMIRPEARPVEQSS